MNLREHAEKIANDFCLGEFTDEKLTTFIDTLESVLKSVVEEALEKMAWGELQKQARAEALEEAARVVLVAFRGGRDNGYGWVEDRAKYAADQIRALAKRSQT